MLGGLLTQHLKEVTIMRGVRKTILKGEKFGRWTVLRDREPHELLIHCGCKCGTVRDMSLGALTCGDSKGCAKCRPIAKGSRRKITTHGDSVGTGRPSKLYMQWNSYKRKYKYDMCEDFWDFAKYREAALAKGYRKGYRIVRPPDGVKLTADNMQWKPKKRVTRS